MRVLSYLFLSPSTYLPTFLSTNCCLFICLSIYQSSIYHLSYLPTTIYLPIHPLTVVYLSVYQSINHLSSTIYLPSINPLFINLSINHLIFYLLSTIYLSLKVICFEENARGELLSHLGFDSAAIAAAAEEFVLTKQEENGTGKKGSPVKPDPTSPSAGGIAPPGDPPLPPPPPLSLSLFHRLILLLQVTPLSYYWLICTLVYPSSTYVAPWVKTDRRSFKSCCTADIL